MVMSSPFGQKPKSCTIASRQCELHSRSFEYNDKLQALIAAARLNSQAFFASFIGVNDILVAVESQAVQSNTGAKITHQHK